MRISGTGKGLKTKFIQGYTLLEVLAVITLIGLVSVLVMPRFIVSLEKNQVAFIGKLIRSDLELVKNEALANETAFSFVFTEKGYSFKLGEREITRNYNNYQFKFLVSPKPPEDSEADSADPNNEIAPAVSNEETGAEETGEESPSTLTIAKDGVCNGLNLNWETSHYLGSLDIDRDGVVNWSYGRKNVTQKIDK